MARFKSLKDIEKEYKARSRPFLNKKGNLIKEIAAEYVNKSLNLGKKVEEYWRLAQDQQRYFYVWTTRTGFFDSLGWTTDAAVPGVTVVAEFPAEGPRLVVFAKAWDYGYHPNLTPLIQVLSDEVGVPVSEYTGYISML